MLISLHSCSQVANLETQPQVLGNGTIRTYVKLDDQNQPIELGVILTEAALTGLPEHAAEVILPLPAQAATTVFDHIGFDWRSHGHHPDPIYGLPHFDLHAYTITQEDRKDITLAASSLEKAYLEPEADFIPTGYILAPDSAEPGMGSHWINPAAEEFQGEPKGFDHTLIYGFYDSNLAFVEPMVSLDFLDSQQEFDGTMPTPKRYSRAGAYPTGYRIAYNTATKEHIIALTGFTHPGS